MLAEYRCLLSSGPELHVNIDAYHHMKILVLLINYMYVIKLIKCC